ncbi:MAG: GrpB family protein [Chitinispirillaceae bacterium]|nr:GrpB family protein [Chitinispirillaceae bacterium]
MNRSLATMTPEELGELFPVIISSPDPRWGRLYQREKERIKKALGGKNIVRIQHIGSTAVPGLVAKPTIDILLEVPEKIDAQWIVEKMERLEYHYIARPENPAPHMMFAAGYTVHGFKGQAYHVHVRYGGDWDELYFRDYLRAHPDVAKEYGELKIGLAQIHRNDREAYTGKKTAFIQGITVRARMEKT